MDSSVQLKAVETKYINCLKRKLEMNQNFRQTTNYLCVTQSPDANLFLLLKRKQTNKKIQIKKKNVVTFVFSLHRTIALPDLLYRTIMGALMT